MSGIAPARFPQTAQLLSPDFWVFVTSVDDLPSPVGGVISLLGEKGYIIGPGLDLLGSQLSIDADVAIIGIGAEVSSITSTGLATGKPVIIGSGQPFIKDLTIKDVGTALGLDTGVPESTKALEWSRVNFSNVPDVGAITDYGNVLIDVLGLLNGSEQMAFRGTVGTIALTNAFANVAAGAGLGALIFDALTVTRRIRIENSAFVVTSGKKGIVADLAGDLVVPDEAFILNTVNFAGGATESENLDGISADDDAALFAKCVGVRNSSFAGYMTMSGNATATTIAAVDTPVKIAGTTVERITEKFTHTNGRLTYTGRKERRFYVQAKVTADGADTYAVYIAVNGAVVPYTAVSGELTVLTNTAPLSPQHLVTMQADDYIEVWIENRDNANNPTVTDLNVIVINVA